MIFGNEKESINFEGELKTGGQSMPSGIRTSSPYAQYGNNTPEQSFYIGGGGGRNTEQTLNNTFRASQYSGGTDFSTAVDKYCDLSHANAYHTIKSLL